MTRQLQLQAQPGQVEPEIAKTAEIVVDVQNDFGPKGRLAASARPGFRLQQSLPPWLQQPTHQILQPPRMR